MSAICGIVNFDGQPVGQAELEALVRSAPHRGPDGTRYWRHGNVGFAHQAFELTERASRERQPLVSADANLVLLADARLDNREDLGKALDVAPGDSARLTDPELLLHAYRKWKDRCAEHLLGDFVFTVWNRETRQLLLARDPLGAHGLAYAWNGNRLVFASETTAVLDHPGVGALINEDAVLKTLAGMPLDENETFFESVHALAPAHYLQAGSGTLRTWRYWDIDPAMRIVYRQDDEYTDHFLELLEQAVACRLPTSGPVGISLSGGHDSTLLAAIAARQLGSSDPSARLKSFSYVFDRFSECDERQYIEPVVRQHNIDATYLPADDKWSFSDMETRVVPRDYLWTNVYSQLPEMIADGAHDAGCRTLIDGMFGDALFCEPSLFAADLIRRGRFIRLIALFARHGGEFNRWRELVQRGIRPLAPVWLKRLVRSYRNTDMSALSPGLTQPRLERLRALSHQRSEEIDEKGLSPGTRIRRARIFNVGWAQGFTATRNNPYNRRGVERVSPYFDRRLVDFVMAIPTEQVSHAGRPRRLQNDVMRRLLPREVCERRDKASFEPLLREGMQHAWPGVLECLGKGSLVISDGWIQKDWMMGLEEQSCPDDETAWAAAVCLNLELWLNAARPPG